MTNGDGGGSRLSRNERRDLARTKSQEIRAEHKKKERRNRWLLQGGIVVASIAIIAVVAVVIVNSIRPPMPGPLNMQSDGIRIGEGYVAETTPALRPGDTPVPHERDTASDVISIQMYIDYLCPICGQFEEVNGPLIDQLVADGAATIEYHPLAILTSKSAGTQYSLRAANAAACVANYDPDSFYNYNSILFSKQPEEGTEGHTNDELVKLSRTIGVASPASIERCINDVRFKSWVQEATNRALNGPIPGADVTAITGTPTVIVNGAKFNYTFPFDADEFSAFLVQAAGQSFTETSTATPTPTPEPAPAP